MVGNKAAVADFVRYADKLAAWLASTLLSGEEAMVRGNCGASRGFSLIELLIVISILGIISTIATPILLSARVRAVDAKAESSLRSVVSAEFAFYAANGYFGSLAELADPPNHGIRFLDERFTSGDLGNNIRCSLFANGQHFQAQCFADPQPPYHTYVADDTGLIQEQP
jgi:prepilin-type N-terminal cleavage/methylation domain-containing protein